MCRSIRFCATTVATVGLIHVGANYGTGNMWIVAGCVLVANVLVDVICSAAFPKRKSKISHIAEDKPIITGMNTVNIDVK